MGCDAYIVDETKECTVTLKCYECGKEIDPNNRHDIKQHEFCKRSDKGIPVSVEWDNLGKR